MAMTSADAHDDAELRTVSLQDKFLLEDGQIYLSGVQALVRLLIEQRRRDQRAGLNTEGFVSGYRGSPLGGLDHELWRAEAILKANAIHFVPGVNEELAATALWGSQQTGVFGGARVDGAFGLWYGKGPGVDRSLDALKHANLAGTSRHGGVLAVAGDDHISQSSTLAHQSDQTLIAAMIPVLNPASVQEYLQFGLLGIALSRFSGCWVGFKALAETVESSSSISARSDFSINEPVGFDSPPAGLHLRWPDSPLEAEARLHGPKMDAVAAFVRANSIDRITLDSRRARLGIVTTGKASLDVAQALIELGLDRNAEELGLRIYKVGMSWPLEREGALRFAEGLEEILVVEEKQGLIESQLATLLYNMPADRRPRLYGKRDADGRILLPTEGQLSAATVARALASRIKASGRQDKELDQRVARIESLLPGASFEGSGHARVPTFCSGCPHSSSTRLPEGSRAHGGIGCHGIATFSPVSRTEGLTQMGGEGANWIGQAPFATDRHIFQNLGDGTYTHSGLLAVRAAVAAGVNITYKILYNDAVAMTGGQPAEGQFSVADIAFQVAAEGVVRIDILSDQPEIHRLTTLPPGVAIHHRDALETVQRELRDIAGTSVIIFEQTCATEKRRRRKRGQMADPAIRVFINPEVCEGCGDCSEASSCVSVVPLETEYGRKRAIDQSTCNKDISCVKGFCPSFLIVEGGAWSPPRSEASHSNPPELPEPVIRRLDRPYDILVAGVGGTGVVTVGALLGMAAHLEAKGCTVSDFTGLAQKGGAVTSHVRLAPRPEELHAVRIAPGNADLVLAFDPIAASSAEALATVEQGRTSILVNDHIAPTGEFLINPDLDLSRIRILSLFQRRAGREKVEVIDASKRALALAGDAIGTNAFLLGVAFQKGLIPLSRAAIEQAIRLNGAAVDMNLRAFAWGRVEAAMPDYINQLLGQQRPEAAPREITLDDVITSRADLLTRYQDEAYAAHFRAQVGRIRAVEAERCAGSERVTMAVARSLAKLMAYKDEYEVARLHTQIGFRDVVAAQFKGNARIHYSFAPPLFARRDPVTGRARKSRFGPWMTPLLRLLAHGKILRGSVWDPFGRLADRKVERALIADYERQIDVLCALLTRDNLAIAASLAELPMKVRGYGHVKDRSIEEMRARRSELQELLSKGQPARRLAAVA